MVMLNPEQEVPKSRLMVEFAELGSAIFNIKFDNVLPIQLLALAAYLEAMAKADLLEQREMRKVQVPIAMPNELLRR